MNVTVRRTAARAFSTGTKGTGAVGVDRTRQSRPIDWSALSSKLTSDGARSEFARLRATYGEIQGLANTYAEPPSPIDFAGYKAKIAAPGLVEKFEAAYNGVSYPKAVARELDEVRQEHATMIADAEQSVADSVSRIEALTALVETMESNMVSPDTTLEQLYEVYPDLEAEIEAEIEAHEWGKDI
uniref:ATP synthase subunit d, mitochondrial n=1 Tax=Florenciella parvula TaxID=236787 RepID=A0A7S2CQH6_9STRA|mmetsp:Transcript_4396/g.9100  ORF Transcript_4396/g.9100 Transcript_4396/m.9100 type:complete len:185 (+) Transcript_4396:40-594(+)